VNENYGVKNTKYIKIYLYSFLNLGDLVEPLQKSFLCP